MVLGLITFYVSASSAAIGLIWLLFQLGMSTGWRAVDAVVLVLCVAFVAMTALLAAWSKG